MVAAVGENLLLPHGKLCLDVFHERTQGVERFAAMRARDGGNERRFSHAQQSDAMGHGDCQVGAVVPGTQRFKGE
jgi:hypothetical protein